MYYVAIMELRGFTAISECLSRELEIINVSSASIRSSIVSIVSNIVDQILEKNKNAKLSFYNILGGDTWGFIFDNFDESLYFCSNVLSTIYSNLHTKGLFYIKPSVSISKTDSIALKDGKLLDDGYINAYRLADKGNSYTLYLHENVADDLRARGFFGNDYISIDEGRNIFNWQRYGTECELLSDINIKASIYDIMFDNNIMLLDNIEKSVNSFIELQNKSKEIFILGGTIDYAQEHLCRYLKEIINLFHTKQVKCTVINYIRPNQNNEKIYIAVSIFKKLMDLYPDKFAYSIYQIPECSLIPTPYHIYNNQYIQFIMRKYTPQRNGLVAISSFVLKNQEICKYYHDEILENYRCLGRLEDDKYKSLVKSLEINVLKMKKCDIVVDKFLNGEFKDA